VVLVQRAFLSRDPFVFPESLLIIIVLLNVLHDFIVRNNLLEFVFTHEALELPQYRVVSDVLLVVIKNLNDASAATKPITIFLH
jgi:hypothetical protein